MIHGFIAATTLTSWHLMVTYCTLHVAYRLNFFENKPIDTKTVVLFGLLNGISIGLLNLSLGFNSIGFYQVYIYVRYIYDFHYVTISVIDQPILMLSLNNARWPNLPSYHSLFYWKLFSSTRSLGEHLIVFWLFIFLLLYIYLPENSDLFNFAAKR